MLHKITQSIKLYHQLGFSSLWHFFIYKIKLRSGYFKWRLPIQGFKDIEIQSAACFFAEDFLLEQRCKALSAGEQTFFFRHFFQSQGVPDWFDNPFQQQKIAEAETKKHWSTINLFHLGCDVKIIWESSRFYWFTRLAQGWCLTQNKDYLKTLNVWLSDWCQSNPMNQGPNWACAQETAIRLINFLLGLIILKPENIHEGMVDFIYKHCERILPSLSYAKSQNNNHATSEASALYMAGAFLLQHLSAKKIRKRAKLYLDMGKKNLTERVQKLVLDDGTFAQYSITYHRLFLDTLSICLFWQRHFALASFPACFMDRYHKAFNWLYQLVDPITFDAPNLGANDGAVLFKLDICDFRDFRPSLQLASYILFGKTLFSDGPHNQILQWLNVDVDALEKIDLPWKAEAFDQGGFVKVILSKKAWLLLRYPRFKFRPSQADLFHLDLWQNGQNILIDAGSYSYNCEEKLYQYFTGASSHNTIMVDDRDPMPRKGRFLFSNWPACKLIQAFHPGQSWRWQGTFTDSEGVIYSRALQVVDHHLEIIDHISGYKQCAVIHFHFAKDIVCDFSLNGQPIKPKVAEMPHSQYYLTMDSHLCLSIEAQPQEAMFKTRIRIQD